MGGYYKDGISGSGMWGIWTGLSWLRIMDRWWALVTVGNEPSGCIMRGIS
jgi:hypothetical protein